MARSGDPSCPELPQHPELAATGTHRYRWEPACSFVEVSELADPKSGFVDDAGALRISARVIVFPGSLLCSAREKTRVHPLLAPDGLSQYPGDVRRYLPTIGRTRMASAP